MYWSTYLYEKISRYYKNTYIKIPECTGLVFVYEVGSNIVRMRDYEQNIYEVNLKNGYNLQWQMPTNRIYFQHGIYAYCLTRVPAKQYQRGISEANTVLYRLTQDGKLTSITLHWDILNSLVNKLPYTTIDLAWAQLKNDGVCSRALTHRIAMTRNGVLYVDMVPVGFFSAKKNKIVCLPAYESVFYDFLSNTGNPGAIKVEAKNEKHWPF